MKRILTGRFVFLACLCVAGGALSQKAPPPVVLSQTIQSHSRLMSLKWESWPGRRYAVETSTAIGGWQTIKTGLQGPAGIGQIDFPIPDEYLFDSKRFFRVRIEPTP
jgi:hypothetical protein